MTLMPMRFKGVQWRHNPVEISFECDKAINEILTPNKTAYIQNMGKKNMKILGKGILYGADCLEQFKKLLDLFKQGGSGALVIDKMEPVYAVFESLKVIGQAKPDMLSYSFVFREVAEKKIVDKPKTHKVDVDENLWDIAYKYSLSIDTLVKLNPFVKRPDEIEIGAEVALC